MKALQELGDTLGDVIYCGDLWGHLQAWWRVVRGEIDVEARIVPAGAVVADDPPAPVTAAVAPFYSDSGDVSDKMSGEWSERSACLSKTLHECL